MLVEPNEQLLIISLSWTTQARRRQGLVQYANMQVPQQPTLGIPAPAPGSGLSRGGHNKHLHREALYCTPY